MKKEKQIKVLIVKPMEIPYVTVLENELATFQGEVGGYIECLNLSNRVAIICNEEGKIDRLPLNRALYTPNGEMFDIVAGTFIIAGDDYESGEFVSLTDEEIEHYTDKFYHPEVFVRIGESIEAIKVPVDEE